MNRAPSMTHSTAASGSGVGRTLPTIVIGGYLGAGKTTLVNHLVRHAQGLRLAIMVNDFGEIGIDADLIVSQDGAVMNLAGGCVCCSVGSDLVSALIELGERIPLPDLVIIETSGVALPASVARSARLAPDIEIQAVVVLADAETVQDKAHDEYVGDTVMQQLREADLLLINKLDLAGDAQLAALDGWLNELAPRAPRLPTRESAIPLQVLLDLAPERTLRDIEPPFATFSGPGRLRPPAFTTAAAVFESASVRLSAPVAVDALAARLLALRPLPIRIKGIVVDPERGPLTMQAVGPRLRIEVADASVAAALRGGGHLVVIGLAGQFDRSALMAALGPEAITADATLQADRL